MSQKLFRLASAIFALALLAGCGPVTPYEAPILQSAQISTVTPLPSATPTLALPTRHPNPTQGYYDYVKGFGLSPDGRTLVVSTTRQTTIVNAESMTVIKTLPIAYGESKFNLSGKLLYLSGRYFNLLLNMENWEVPTSYEADWNYLHYGSKVQVSPNGQTFAFAYQGYAKECDGVNKTFEFHRLHSDAVPDDILYRKMICAHWARVVYKYNAKGDRLFLGYESANFENDQSAPNLLAIIDTENGNVIRKFGLTEPVEFIADDLGIIYLRSSDLQFLLWNLDSEDYVGTSKTAKLKLEDNLFLTISLEGESFITESENSAICQIGKMYGYDDHPAIFQFQQANGRLAYLDFVQNEIFYWDILNCRLINTLKLSDITSQ